MLFKRLRFLTHLITIILQRENFKKLEYEARVLHGLPQKIGQHLCLYVSNCDLGGKSALLAYGNPEEIPIHHYLQQASLIPCSVERAAQASVGQVFKVTVTEKVFAVKVKYEDIEEAIKVDFRLIHVFLTILKLLPVRVKPLAAIVDQVRTSLLRECDYQAERATQQRFHEFFKESKNTKVPITFADCSTDKMIVSEWMDGVFISDYLKSAPGKEKEQVFDALFQFQLRALFCLGTIHSDPHPGNFLIQQQEDGPVLVAIDFGSVQSYSPSETAALGRLLGFEYEDREQLLNDLLLLGFNASDIEYYSPVLPDLLSIMLEPFYYFGEYHVEEWRVQYKLNTLMASRQWDKALELPLKILFLLRMFQGLYYYARQFNIKYDWKSRFENIMREGGRKHE